MNNNDKKNESYFVKIPHTKEECLNSLDEMKSKGSEFLSKFNFGCSAGDHTAYAIFEGKTESEIKNMLPSNLRPKAIVTKVGKYTPQEIEEMHHAM